MVVSNNTINSDCLALATFDALWHNKLIITMSIVDLYVNTCCLLIRPDSVDMLSDI